LPKKRETSPASATSRISYGTESTAAADEEEAARDHEDAARTGMPGTSAEQMAAPEPDPTWSVGTLGHPLACAEACKYANKKRGCKDGAACVRCHVCKWTTSKAKKGQRFADVVGGLGDPGFVSCVASFHG